MKPSAKGFDSLTSPLLSLAPPMTRHRSRMWVAPGPGGFCMMFLTERTNWWYRLWQRMFFGFIWEDISEQNTTRQ